MVTLKNPEGHTKGPRWPHQSTSMATLKNFGLKRPNCHVTHTVLRDEQISRFKAWALGSTVEKLRLAWRPRDEFCLMTYAKSDIIGRLTVPAAYCRQKS